MKHTPGPWRVLWAYDTERSERVLTVCTPYSYAKDGTHLPEQHIAECAKYTPDGEDDETKANARLIAKAPELVAVLARIVEWIDAGCDPSTRSIETARALLGKIDRAEL